MLVVNLLQEVITLVEGLLGHFVQGTATAFTPLDDGEWTMAMGSLDVTGKGNALMGAVADITVYGAILVDWILQGLLGQAITFA